MIGRVPSSFVKGNASWFPVVSATGSRPSGKAALVQQVFSDYAYAEWSCALTRAMW